MVTFQLFAGQDIFQGDILKRISRIFRQWPDFQGSFHLLPGIRDIFSQKPENRPHSYAGFGYCLEKHLALAKIRNNSDF